MKESPKSLPVKMFFSEGWKSNVARLVAFSLIVGAVLTVVDLLKQGVVSSILTNQYFGFFLLVSTVYLVSRSVPSFFSKSTLGLYQALISESASLIAEEKYETVIRLRKTMSRFLWLQGKYAERVQLGSNAEEAAGKLGKKECLMEVKIDDLGWTQIPLNNIPEAKRSINSGLTLAIDEQNFFWVAKAHRHLALLSCLENSSGVVDENFRLAKEAADKINDDTKKREMLAGIALANAETHIYQGNYVDANPLIKDATKIWIELDDRSRLVRTYFLNGYIKLRKNDANPAIDDFLLGLNESIKIGRVVEQIKNLQGLSAAYSQIKDTGKASKYKNDADKLKIDTPLSFEFISLTE